MAFICFGTLLSPLEVKGTGIWLKKTLRHAKILCNTVSAGQAGSEPQNANAYIQCSQNSALKVEWIYIH